MKKSRTFFTFRKIRLEGVFDLHPNYLYSEGHQNLTVRIFLRAKWKIFSKMLFSIGNPTISKSKEIHWILLIPLTFRAVYFLPIQKKSGPAQTCDLSDYFYNVSRKICYILIILRQKLWKFRSKKWKFLKFWKLSIMNGGIPGLFPPPPLARKRVLRTRVLLRIHHQGCIRVWRVQ